MAQTVGELVEARRCELLEERGTNCDPYELHDDVLRALGIWDAEVLEGAVSAPLVQRADGYCGVEFTVGGTPVCIERERVRVIVLKEGEVGNNKLELTRADEKRIDDLIVRTLAAWPESSCTPIYRAAKIREAVMDGLPFRVSKGGEDE